jgi:hypothetical protein
MPEPGDILADVKALGDWVQNLRARQQTVQVPRSGHKEHTVLDVEPTGERLSKLMAACDAADIRARILARINSINGPPDSDNAREIIAGKLAQLAARNGGIGDFGE